jgi:hypothetical protein
MKTYKTAIIASLIMLSSQLSASEIDAAKPVSSELQAIDSNVSIKWVEPKKFQDVRHASMSRKRYRNAVFSELEEYFKVLADDLPEGQTLNIEVTDLDLAGTVQSLAMAGLNNFPHSLNHSLNDYRVMRNIDIPRMTFSYQLMDQNQQIIKQEQVNLKDMSFLSRSSFHRRNEELRYEKVMISRWFDKTFEHSS